MSRRLVYLGLAKRLSYMRRTLRKTKKALRRMTKLKSDLLKLLSEESKENISNNFYEKCKNCSVYVAVKFSEKHGRTGSGVIISKDGLILSCSHLLEPPPPDILKPKMDISVCLFDGSIYEVKVADICDGHDLMLLKIKRRVDICDSHDLKTCSEVSFKNFVCLEEQVNIFVGMSAYCISCPSSTQFSFSTGVVSYSCRDNFTIKVPGLDPDTCFLQTNVATNTGSSGGGVFNSHGDMLGIHSQISEYVKLAIHIKTIIKFVESYKKSIASCSKSALNQPRSFGSHHQTSHTSHPKAELQSMRVRGGTWRGRGAALCSRGRGRGDTRIASLSGSAPNQPRTFAASHQTSSTSHSEAELQSMRVRGGTWRGRGAALCSRGRGRGDTRIASLSGPAPNQPRPFAASHQTSSTSHSEAELQSMRVRGGTWRGRGAAPCSRGRGRGDTRIASLSGSAPNQPRPFAASHQTSSTSHSESVRGKSAVVKCRDDRRIASLSGSATRRGRGGAGRPSKLT